MAWRSQTSRRPSAQAAITSLLVDLFASVGLWVGAAWGPVMWAVALAVEVSMYTLFSDLFGSYPRARGAAFRSLHRLSGALVP